MNELFIYFYICLFVCFLDVFFSRIRCCCCCCSSFYFLFAFSCLFPTQFFAVVVAAVVVVFFPAAASIVHTVLFISHSSVVSVHVVSLMDFYYLFPFNLFDAFANSKASPYFLRAQASLNAIFVCVYTYKFLFAPCQRNKKKTSSSHYYYFGCHSLICL